jgi:phosphatidylinositol-3-phosphatase
LLRRSVLVALLIISIIGVMQPELGSSTGGPAFSHVVVIMLENRPINGSYGIINQPGGPFPLYAPYITSLANNYSLATNYYSVDSGGCGSITDYIGITSGNVSAINNACNAHAHCNGSANITTSCSQPEQNIADTLEASGLTWKAYLEGMEVPCELHGSTGFWYDVGHNPWVYYSDIRTNTARCNSHVVPAGKGPNNDTVFLNDLNGANPPNFMWLTPNICNDMYVQCPSATYPNTSVGPNSCTQTSANQATCIGEGDSYLKAFVPQIMNTQAMKSGTTLLYITWDEPTFGDSNSNASQCPRWVANPPRPGSHCQIPGIFVGPLVKQHYTSNTAYTHFNFLKTVENNWGLPTLTTWDASATPMSEFLVPQLPPSADFALTANPTSATANVGSTSSSTISVAPINGFTGTVELSVNTNSTGLVCSMSPTSVSQGSGTSTLQCQSNLVGAYRATVKGSSGSLSHLFNVTFSFVALDITIPSYVVMIVLENQNLGRVYGSGCSLTDCAYTTQLANTYGIAMNYSGVAHDSLPNYLTLTSGANYSNFAGSCSSSPDVFNCDCSPIDCWTTNSNLVDTITQSGKTWRAYMEDYVATGGCQLTDATGGRPFNATIPNTEYASHHNPFVYYQDVTSNATRCANIVNANGQYTGYFAGPTGGLPTVLLSDLNNPSPPNLMWLTPNLCNDGHDSGTAACPLSDPVAEQNNYLQQLVPAILSTTTFKTKPAALFITWDEGSICPTPGQTFPMCTDPVASIWVGPTISPSYQSNNIYSHYSFVTTLENLWGLNPLPTPATVNPTPMLDFFDPPPIQSNGLNGGSPMRRM